MFGEPLGIIAGLLARLHGPMSFRLFIQPLIALFFAFRDGRRDAREGLAPWRLFTDREARPDLIRSSWKSVGKVLIVACGLDLIFQCLAFGLIRPGGALVTAVILALIPYLLLRGPVNYLTQRMTRGAKS